MFWAAELSAPADKSAHLQHTHTHTHTHTHCCHSGSEWCCGPLRLSCHPFPFPSVCACVCVRLSWSQWRLDLMSRPLLLQLEASSFWRRIWRCRVSDANPAGLIAASSPPSLTHMQHIHPILPMPLRVTHSFGCCCRLVAFCSCC